MHTQFCGPTLRWVIALVLVATGCRGPGRPAAAVAPVMTDTIWYISARARQLGRDTRTLADTLEYGMVVSSVQQNGDQLLNNFGTTPIDSVQLTATAFAAAIHERAQDANRGDSLAVLMVHGFGTSLHEAWDYASQSRIRSRSNAPWVVFCWPSNGAGVAWPNASQFLLRAYREDSAAAASSHAAFSSAMRVMLPAIGGSNLLIVAHSMGAQLVGETLADDHQLRDALASNPLRALAFLAPDVESRYFNEAQLPLLTPLAQRVVVYASTDDRMLTISRAVNRSDRAGLIRGRPMSPRGVEFVDATDGYSAENAVQRVIGSHHTIRRASAALFDLMHVVAGGYSADCRATLGTASLAPEGTWKLTTLSPPLLSALADCSR